MAKVGRSARRPAAAKKARPAVAKTGTKTFRPVVARKPAAAKTAARPAAKSAARLEARGAATTVPKPKRRSAARPSAKAQPKSAARAGARPSGRSAAVAPVQPPRRSTYADAVLLYERGLQALQGKRYRDAADILRRVIADFPEEKELHERAQLYIRVCERQLAPPDATPKTPEEQVYAATLAINAGAIDRAVALLTAALQQHKENDYAEYMFGVALTLRGDTQGALAHFARAVELNPDNRELLRKEPELENLRQTDELRAILAAPAAPGRKDRRPQPRARR